MIATKMKKLFCTGIDSKALCTILKIDGGITA